MTYKRRRIATLDLGTNSLLLLVAERNKKGKIRVLADESAMPRLGEGLRANGRVAPQVLSRAAEAVATFTKKARDLGAEEVFVTATSATREAENRDEVLSVLSRAGQVQVELLPPNEEARLTYLSVTMERESEAPCLVVDIGGGSTEVTWGIGSRFDGGRSLNLGTIKVLESHLQDEIPSKEELAAARGEIDSRLLRVAGLPKVEHYYGTAGTFTHLASVDLGLRNYHPEKIAGHALTRENVEAWVTRLAQMTRPEKLALPGIDPRRVDVLLPGTLILERLFPRFRNDVFSVFDRGIRFGKLFDRLRRFSPPVIFS